MFVVCFINKVGYPQFKVGKSTGTLVGYPVVVSTLGTCSITVCL